MPFDALSQEVALDTDVPGVPSLLEPSLAGLSYVLRHEELWLAGFEWWYGSPCNCALGLATELWDFQKFPETKCEAIERISGIPRDIAYGIFYSAGEFCEYIGYIQPADIANLIDHYLAATHHD